jgi:hypothetical protein
MSFYKIDDIRPSDVKFNTLSLGNIPISIVSGRVMLVDPNNAVPRIDSDGCDTPNFSLRTCNWEHAERLRSSNERTRHQADSFIERSLGRVDSAALMSSDNLTARSILALFGSVSKSEISAAALPPRRVCRTANVRIHTNGDPDFRIGDNRYRRFRRNDSHRLLLDSSWVGPASRHPSEIVK